MEGEMEPCTILIADTDPAFVRELSFFISHDLPETDITVCVSTQHAVEQLSCFYFSTVIADCGLIHEEHSGILQQKRTRYALVPLIVTASDVDRELALDALLHRGAFDIIAKPVNLTEARPSLHLALWHGQFLRLLTQRERLLSHFQRHLEVYPHERDTGGERGWISKQVDDTLRRVQESRSAFDPHLNEVLIDLAGSVEEWTYERGCNRLASMKADRVWT